MLSMNSFYIYITKITLDQKYYCLFILSELLPEPPKSKTFLPLKIPCLPEKHEVRKNGNYLKNILLALFS